jgi:ethanolamine utilization microcompartment shell protein EutS
MSRFSEPVRSNGFIRLTPNGHFFINEQVEFRWDDDAVGFIEFLTGKLILYQPVFALTT